MQLNILVFPYRDSLFRKKYGPTVRDLQIIDCLRRREDVASVLVFERPISIYEIILKRWVNLEDDSIRQFSFDVLGPLKGRSWTESCYKRSGKYLELYLAGKNNIVILDFTPIAKIPAENIPHDFYWYDLIDNFKKHNRYSAREKDLVDSKYRWVDANAQLISGVSPAALSGFSNMECVVSPNGISSDPPVVIMNQEKFKYGFIGFITNKFHVDWVERLSLVDPDFGLAVFGEILDSSTKARLSIIRGVELMGPFNESNLGQIMGQFRVGLIPYREDKSHDGSPIKLYQYLQYGKPVLSSLAYEYSGVYMVVGDVNNLQSAVDDINDVLLVDGLDVSIPASVDASFFIENRVDMILQLIKSKMTGND